MRFVLMHKTNPDNEAGIRPPSRAHRRGRQDDRGDVAGRRLPRGRRPARSALGVRLTFAGGKRTVTPGPFVGGNELPSAMGILRVRSRDEAVEWASRLGEVLGDAEIDVRPLYEPKDLG